MSARFLYRKNDLLEKEGAQTMSDLQELTNNSCRMLRLERNMKLFSRRDLTLSLIRARKEAGLTQAELSEKTGISQADISKIRCVNLF